MRKKVCIVGSGIGGGVVAHSLVNEDCFDVTILDLGAVNSDQINQELEVVYTGHPFNQDVTRAFGFGGTSNLWHGVLTELDPEDMLLLDRYAGSNVSREIRQYYKKNISLFPGSEVLQADTSIDAINNSIFYNTLQKSGRFLFKNFAIQSRPLRTRTLIKKLVDRKAITVVENAVVLTLEEGDVRGELRSITYVTGGRRFRLEADIFIICAGALETPRIFLQSIQEGLISIANDNIGSFLVDHPWAVAGEVRSKAGKCIKLYNEASTLKNIKFRIGLRQVRSACLESDEYKWDNHCISFKPLFLSEYKKFKGAIKDIISLKGLAGTYKLVRKHRFSNIASSLLLLALEKFSSGINVDRALIFIYLEQTPSKKSNIKLSDEYDCFGRNIPIVNWELSARSKISVEHLLVALENELNEVGLFDVERFATEEVEFSSGSHHAGTMRINADETKGVVDSNLKVHGLKNAYICDLSIFPNYGNSNPTFTLSAIAMRLADHITG